MAYELYILTLRKATQGFILQNRLSLEDSLVSEFKFRLLHSFHWDSNIAILFFCLKIKKITLTKNGKAFFDCICDKAVSPQVKDDLEKATAKIMPSSFFDVHFKIIKIVHFSPRTNYASEIFIF